MKELMAIIESCNEAFDKVFPNTKAIKSLLDKLNKYTQEQRVKMLVAITKNASLVDLHLTALATIAVVLGERKIDAEVKEQTIEDMYPEHFVKVVEGKKYSNKVKHYKAVKKDNGKVISKIFKDEFTAKSWVGNKLNGKVWRIYHKQFVLTGELMNGEIVTHKSCNLKRLEKIAKTRMLENYTII